MKRIIKNGPPDFFQTWKDDFTSRHGRAPDFSTDFIGEVRRMFKAYLMDEQGCICCYCMQRIADDSAHFEHFKPQSVCEAEVLEYTNMLLSCNGHQGDRTHCGHKHGSEFYPMLLSPLSPDIEECFDYSSSGKISGLTAEAGFTIQTLALDQYHLNEQRKRAIFVARKLYDDPSELIDVFCSRDENGAFKPFCTAVVQYYKSQYKQHTR